MLKPYDPTDNAEPVPPQCRATVELLQRALDGDASAEALDADAHPGACPTCRERLRAARVLLAALAVPAAPVVVPSGFADRVLGAMKADRRARSRRRVFAAVGGLAVAAAVLVGVWFIVNANGETKPGQPQPKGFAKQPEPPEVAPAPREKPEPAPEPRPLRIGETLASAGQTLTETPKPLADSVAVAPKLFGALTGPFTGPPGPMAADLEPARQSLAGLPDAARTGMEPVTDTAQKALGRFLRDVGSVQPKPNS
jgi:hypothetical protein